MTKWTTFHGSELERIQEKYPISQDQLSEEDISEGMSQNIPPDFQFTMEELNKLVEIVDSDVSGGNVNAISDMIPVQNGAGFENTVTPPESVLREFSLLESALGHIETHRVVFNPPEESLTDGGIILIDPVETLHTYIDKIRALIESQIQNWGGRDGIKASISQKVYLQKGQSGDIFHFYFSTGNQTFYPGLNNFEDNLFNWVNKLISTLDTFNEKGSGSTILFIEHLDLKLSKLKKQFTLRGAGGHRRIKCHPDLSATGGVQGLNFDAGLKCFKYAFLAAAHRPLAVEASMKKLDEFARNGGEISQK